MVDWEKIKADITTGLKDGAETLKEGTGVVAKKAAVMSANSKRKVKIFNKKRHIQDYMEELGVAVYHLEKAAPGAITDSESVAIIKKIDQANAELLELEEMIEKGNDNDS